MSNSLWQACCGAWAHVIRGSALAGKVYLVLWLAAIFTAAWSSGLYFLGHRPEAAGTWELIVTIAFGLATFTQQLMIYSDIHRLERDSAADYDLDWIGSSLEKSLRLFIILFLLLAAGKLASVIYPILSCPVEISERGWACNLFSPDGVERLSLFTVGSLLVFFLILVWNGGAMVFARKSWVPIKESGGIDAASHFILMFRIGLFMATAAICIIFWLFVVFGMLETLTRLAQILLVPYVIAVFVIMVLRFRKVCSWGARRLAPFWVPGGQETSAS